MSFETVTILKSQYEYFVRMANYYDTAEFLLAKMPKRGEVLIENFEKWMDKNPFKTSVVLIKGIRDLCDVKNDGALSRYRKETEEWREVYDNETYNQKELQDKLLRKERVECFRQQIREANALLPDFVAKTYNLPLPDIRAQIPDKFRMVGRGLYYTLCTTFGPKKLKTLFDYGVKTPADLANYTAEELAEICSTEKNAFSPKFIVHLANVYGITLKGEQQEATNDN